MQYNATKPLTRELNQHSVQTESSEDRALVDYIRLQVNQINSEQKIQKLLTNKARNFENQIYPTLFSL